MKIIFASATFAQFKSIVHIFMTKKSCYAVELENCLQLQRLLLRLLLLLRVVTMAG